MIYQKSILGFLFAFILFTTSTLQELKAQEQIGLRQSNYAGINSISLNPANATDLPLQWDLNIAAAGVFAENNYAYVNQSNLIHFLKNSGNLSQNNPEDPAHGTGAVPTYDFYNNAQNQYFAQVNSFVSGPSFLLKKGDASFGIFANARMQFNTNKVDPQLGYVDYTEEIVGTSFNIEAPKIAGMSWSEIGIHVGSKVGENIALAGNIKVLQGYDGFYFTGNGGVDLLKQSESLQVSVEELNYAYAGNTDFENGTYQAKVNGWGVGADLGVNIYLGEVTDGPYRLKLGGSLVDVGFVKFGKNAQKHQIQDLKESFGESTFTDVNTEDALAQAISEQALGDANASLQEEQFTLWTPAALSAQVDFAFSEHLYINATAVRGLSFQENALARSNTLSFTPRYESRWFEVAVPMTFYGQEDFRVGTSVKLGFLTVGTDNLGSIVGKKDFTGSDVYVALKFNPMNLDKSAYNRNGGSRTKTKVDCPKSFKWGDKRRLKL